MRVKHYEKNAKGRDFVVGDIHGCYTPLEQELTKLNFDCNVDRLFSVGDLVDRGLESERSLEFLAKPWFHAIKGNHEELTEDVFKFGENTYSRYNGQEWFLNLHECHQALFVEAFEKLPIAADVLGRDGKLYGIVHAQCPTNDWKEFEVALSEGNAAAFENVALWSRERIIKKDESLVENVDLIFCGHTVCQEMTRLGNHIFIDTGAGFSEGKLTVLEFGIP